MLQCVNRYMYYCIIYIYLTYVRVFLHLCYARRVSRHGTISDRVADYICYTSVSVTRSSVHGREGKKLGGWSNSRKLLIRVRTRN